MAYVVAAETVTHLKSRSLLRGGSMTTRPDVITATGRKSAHALDDTTGEIACGRTGEGLYRLGQLWEHLNPYLKCGACREAAG